MRKVNLVATLHQAHWNLDGELTVFVVGRHKDRVDVEDAGLGNNGRVEVLLRADDDANWSKIEDGLRYKIDQGGSSVRGVLSNIVVEDSR